MTGARQHHRLRLQDLLSLLLLACLMAATHARAEPVQPPTQTLTHARITQDNGATWLDIGLPDRWAQRGRQARASAQYELRFDLVAAPGEPLALSFARMGLHRRISVNGQLLLQQRGDGPDIRSRRATAPAFIDLPPALLKTGSNVLLIEVQHAGAGLLSAPVLGPTDALRRSHTMLELVNLDLPQMLNLASLGLALFMLTVWLRRRSERALGWFGALAPVTALRKPVLTDLYLLPFLTPLMLGAMSAFLVARMVAATGVAAALAVELDERVALRTQQLSNANMARARFLSSASHDLRQPVLTIGLLASLLRDDGEAAPGKPGVVARLQAAVASLESLLIGLLDLSRLDPLVVQTRPQAVPLQALFDAIAHHQQASASAQGLRLRLRPTALAVQADPVLLEQVLRNLLSNALRCTQRGGVLVAA